jgi:hypothetical protein
MQELRASGMGFDRIAAASSPVKQRVPKRLASVMPGCTIRMGSELAVGYFESSAQPSPSSGITIKFTLRPVK